MFHTTLTTDELTAIAAGLVLLAGAAVYTYKSLRSPPDPEQAGRSLGERVTENVLAAAGYVTRFVTGLGAGVTMSLTRVMPKSESLWRGVAKRGFRGMFKTAGDSPDAIGIIDRDNGIDLEPVKWKRGDPDNPEEGPRWVTKGGEEWHPGNEGRETELLGTVPVILLDEDAETVGSFLQSRFQAALDIGQKDQLFVPERVEQIHIEGHIDDIEDFAAGGDAVADGGTVQQTTYNIPDHEWPQKLADVLVDLSAPDGEAGMRVSAKQYKEVFQEKVGTEEMQMQEYRGRIGEMDPNAHKDKIKLIIYAFLGGAAMAQAPEILSIIMGSGVGDAVSGLNPFTVMPYLPGVLF